jgi:hypothetical protein
MNERIKKLVFEAVNFRLDPDSNAYEAQVCPEDLELLAELIWKEAYDAGYTAGCSDTFEGGV